jgi:hypothetical protein
MVSLLTDVQSLEELLSYKSGHLNINSCKCTVLSGTVYSIPRITYTIILYFSHLPVFASFFLSFILYFFLYPSSFLSLCLSLRYSSLLFPSFFLSFILPFLPFLFHSCFLSLSFFFPSFPFTCSSFVLVCLSNTTLRQFFLLCPAGFRYPGFKPATLVRSCLKTARKATDYAFHVVGVKYK